MEEGKDKNINIHVDRKKLNRIENICYSFSGCLMLTYMVSLQQWLDLGRTSLK